eukprot:3309356-Ditylum_brightwellii.AAC.1
MQSAVDTVNLLQNKPDRSSQFERLTGEAVTHSHKNNHVFACPVFASNSELQSGKSIPKWNP